MTTLARLICLQTKITECNTWLSTFSNDPKDVVVFRVARYDTLAMSDIVNPLTATDCEKVYALLQHLFAPVDLVKFTKKISDTKYDMYAYKSPYIGHIFSAFHSSNAAIPIPTTDYAAYGHIADIVDDINNLYTQIQAIPDPVDGNDTSAGKLSTKVQTISPACKPLAAELMLKYDGVNKAYPKMQPTGEQYEYPVGTWNDRYVPSLDIPDHFLITVSYMLQQTDMFMFSGQEKHADTFVIRFDRFKTMVTQLKDSIDSTILDL